MDNQLRQIIEEAWNDRALLAESRVREAVRAVIEELDKGRLRTAEPIDPSRSQWQVNEWVKKAILLYFPMQEMRTMRAGELEWHDKMDLKHGYEELGVRVVPHAVARYGAYISPGVTVTVTHFSYPRGGQAAGGGKKRRPFGEFVYIFPLGRRGRCPHRPGRMYRVLRKSSANSQLPNGPMWASAPTIAWGCAYEFVNIFC